MISIKSFFKNSLWHIIFICFVIFDSCLVLFHPSFQSYNELSKRLDERFSKWECSQWSDYINQISNLVNVIQFQSTNTLVSSSFVDHHFSIPCEYHYFSISDIPYFALLSHPSFSYKLGDFFDGARVISISPLSVSLSDGRLLSNKTSFSNSGITNRSDYESCAN